MPRILSFTFLLCLGSMVLAQGPRVFSVHVDPQVSWFSSDEDAVRPDGSMLNLQAGLYMDRYFDRNYAVSLGIGFNRLGGRLHYSDPFYLISKGDTLNMGPGQSIKHQIHYIDIPIGLKFKTEEIGYLTIFLQLGFNPMIRTNAFASTPDERLDKENINDTIYPFSLGYHAGIGVEYRLGGNTALVGGIRWASGLTDISRNDRANININTLSLHAGILF